jgi:hypothetical protein
MRISSFSAPTPRMTQTISPKFVTPSDAAKLYTQRPQTKREPHRPKPESVIFKEIRLDQIAELPIHPCFKFRTIKLDNSATPCVISARNPAFSQNATRPILGLVGVGLTPGLGPRMAGKLLQDFGTPETILGASLTALESKRLPAAVRHTIYTRQSHGAASKELAQIQAEGCHLVTWDEQHYPRRLGEIYDPPPPVCPRKC